jgi:hypothetical protein
MKRLFLALAVFLFAVAASTKITKDEPFAPTVSGFVYDGATYQPVAGAKIEVGGQQVSVTDANGGFKIAANDAGEQTLTAAKPGYVTYTASVDVRATMSTQKVIYLLKK